MTTSTAKRWQDRIGRGASAQSVEINGLEYLVCSGTGDCDGGAFAYIASDVADWLDATDGTPDEAPSTDESGAAIPGGYQDFCDRVDVVETASVARAVRDALGVDIYHGGSCRPVRA